MPSLTEYISAAMRHATYEFLAEDGYFYGKIPPCRGVWANEKTLELCREVLQEVLEDWIVVRLHRGLEVPVIDAIDINPKREEVQA